MIKDVLTLTSISHVLNWKVDHGGGGGGGIVQVGLEVNVTTQQVSHEIINFLYMDARYDLLGFESFPKMENDKLLSLTFSSVIRHRPM